jgi:Family of unknown function (DUF5343)
MPDKHPYVSGSGSLFQIVTQLRKSFPTGGITADTLKKLGLAPNNESYVINILRFIDVIDAEGKRTESAGKVFNQHDDDAFAKAFAGLVKKAYSDLFSLRGDDAWRLDQDALIQYFRSSDDTSAIVGRRQATTFQALSALSGHAELPAIKPGPARKTPADKKKAVRPNKTKEAGAPTRQASAGATRGGQMTKESKDFGLTVRIEINLPAAGDQDTYDRIFKSIRDNLIDGK